MMTAKQIREKQTPHLQAELLEQQKHLYDLRSQAVTEKLEDPSQLRKTKKDIARIKTILRQRELEEAKKSEKAEPTSETKSAKKPAAKAKARSGVKRMTTRTKRTARTRKTETAKA